MLLDRIKIWRPFSTGPTKYKQVLLQRRHPYMAVICKYSPAFANSTRIHRKSHIPPALIGKARLLTAFIAPTRFSPFAAGKVPGGR